MTLAERLLAVHRALRDAGIPHAFGGAIALAYWTEEPRGTRDLDINAFVPATDPEAVLDALPAGVTIPPEAAETIRRDGQMRVMWDDVPLDLFLDYAPVHERAARHAETVPFAGERIDVLGPIELAAFKAMFDRTKDWADIEAMLEAGTLDVPAVRGELEGMLGPDDARWERLERAVRQAGTGAVS